jgi:acyl carrier protein
MESMGMTISKIQVQEFVLHVLTERMSLPIDTAAVGDATRLGPDGLDLESLAFVELTLALETEYSLKIPDEDQEQLAKLTFGEFADDIVARGALETSGRAGDQ